MRRWLVSVLVLGNASSALAVLPPWQSRVPSVIHIDKSENKNQIHYALDVDEQCRLVGDDPVKPYWRDREVGPNAYSELLLIERPGYGVGRVELVSKNRVRFSIRALPDRIMEAQVRTSSSGCTARALIRLNGVPVVLDRLYLELGAIGPKEVRAEGRALQGGAAVVEIMRR